MLCCWELKDIIHINHLEKCLPPRRSLSNIWYFNNMKIRTRKNLREPHTEHVGLQRKKLKLRRRGD